MHDARQNLNYESSLPHGGSIVNVSPDDRSDEFSDRENGKYKRKECLSLAELLLLMTYQL